MSLLPFFGPCNDRPHRFAGEFASGEVCSLAVGIVTTVVIVLEDALNLQLCGVGLSSSSG